MKSLVDFIIDASKDTILAGKFKEKLNTTVSSTDLQKWFSDNKYELSDDECIRMMENKDKILSSNAVKDY
jgi:hypothetical protein